MLDLRESMVVPLAFAGDYLSLPLFVLSATILVSVIVIKIGSVAFRMTGIDRRTAFFQALSAFTGTGFTTRESEKIVAHAARRKIAQILIMHGKCRSGDCDCHRHSGVR